MKNYITAATVSTILTAIAVLLAIPMVYCLFYECKKQDVKHEQQIELGNNREDIPLPTKHRDSQPVAPNPHLLSLADKQMGEFKEEGVRAFPVFKEFEGEALVQLSLTSRQGDVKRFSLLNTYSEDVELDGEQYKLDVLAIDYDTRHISLLLHKVD